MTNTLDELLSRRIDFGCLDADEPDEWDAYTEFLTLLIKVYQEPPPTSEATLRPGSARGGATDRGTVSREQTDALGMAAWNVLQNVPWSVRDGELVAECIKYLEDNYTTMDLNDLGRRIQFLQHNHLLPGVLLLARMVADVLQLMKRKGER